ncbi:hypothetical protein GGR57DRAFT_263855 [Xylariaceae sp. FL1272]|nr:hypothetical protein GGR57DRAFT_263855 [Xylariaceae sp. FL1272]
MPEILHKIKDAVSHHGHHEDDHVHDKKSSSKPSSKRNSRDLNGAPSATHDPADLTGPHREPDHRDIDGLVHSTSHDAPDLIGPHRDHVNVDINGHHATTHAPPDLNSPTASAGSRH